MKYCFIFCKDNNSFVCLWSFCAYQSWRNTKNMNWEVKPCPAYSWIKANVQRSRKNTVNHLLVGKKVDSPIIYGCLFAEFCKNKNEKYLPRMKKTIKTWNENLRSSFVVVVNAKDMSYKDEMVKIWRNVKAYFNKSASAE